MNNFLLCYCRVFLVLFSYFRVLITIDFISFLRFFKNSELIRYSKIVKKKINRKYEGFERYCKVDVCNLFLIQSKNKIG